VLKKNIECKVATENQEQKDNDNNGTNINIVQRIIQRKLNLFGDIGRIGDDRLLKQVVFSKADGKNKIGRPKIRWTDELVDWCEKDTRTLYRMAADRTKWNQLVRYVVDTNGQ